MQTIIAPVDFSDMSVNAAKYAADIADVLRARLILLHVYPVPVPVSEVPVSAFETERLREDAEERIEKLGKEIRLHCNNKIPVDVIVQPGNPLNGIRELCEKEHPYAVVLGAETATAVDKFFSGAVATGAVKQLDWPVMIIPPEAKFKGLRKIGLACDFRNVIETIPYREIRTIVEKFDAELHVLHVSMESGDSFSKETDEEGGWLHDILHELKPQYHFLHEEDTEKALIDYADANKLDMLIIIPKKHNIFSRLLIKTHSKQLVLHAHIPVMSIHE